MTRLKHFIIPVICTLTIIAGTSPANAKKRIAVLDFDFNAIQPWWNGTWDIGSGIADIMVTRLVKDGTYSVIERKQIDQILDEQDFSNSDRADAATAAKIGKILGVDGIVIGSITQFGTENKKKGGIGGLISRRAGAVAGIGLKKTKAKVAINARLVDVNTGEILAVSEGVGKSKRTGLILGGAGGANSIVGGGAYEMESSGFRETILGEATDSAAAAVVRDLVAQYKKLPTTQLVINAKVADYDPAGKEVTITKGKESGVAVGQVFVIKRVTREIKDPDSGEVIRRVAEEIGRFKITEAGKGYAVGKVVAGTGIKTGDSAALVE